MRERLLAAFLTSINGFLPPAPKAFACECNSLGFQNAAAVSYTQFLDQKNPKPVGIGGFFAKKPIAFDLLFS